MTSQHEALRGLGVKEEAQCPYCLDWSEVAFDGSIPPGGFWWVESAGCPRCGRTVCVETECEFRKVTGSKGEARP